MCFAFLAAALFWIWVVVSCVVYLYYYLIEVVFDLPITGQSPCSAHASLKQLIQRFIREAADLPELKKKYDHPALPDEVQEDRTYEDLLSTAIINKVVQTYQSETPKSSTNSLCSRASGSNRTNGGKEYFFSEETLDTKWKNRDATHDDTSSSISSVDDWAKSDSSVGSSKYIDRVSLTIKQRIDEDTTSEDEAPENVNSLEKNALLQSDDAWNENWYLQKRVLGTHSPVPVPMLVPNPTTEAKVLIGDRDAEDTSDLSDAASDFGDPELAPDIKNILVVSKRIIGGKNLIDGAIEENVSLVTSDVDINNTNANAPQSIEDKMEDLNVQSLVDLQEPVDEKEIPTDIANIGVTRSTSNNKNVRSEENVLETEDTSLLSLDSNTEQDTEYTEQYASLPRTILISPKPTPIPRASKMPEIVQLFETNSKEVENEDEKLNLNSELSLLQNTNDSYHGDDELGTFKGSYSEREKEKWKHTIEMPNNPYSPENLERRLSNRSSDDSSNDKYDRDYYIKEAARSAGSRKLLNNAFVTETPGNYPPNDFNTDEDQIKINGDSGTVVKAIPAMVEPEEGTQFVFPSEVPVSSDSDMSIERIYNLESGKVTQKMGDDCEEYTVTLGERSRLTDENHNTYDVDEKKRAFMRSLTNDDSISNDDALRSPDIVKRLVPYPNNKPPVLDQELIDKYDEDLKGGNIVENVDTTKENVTVPYLETEEVVKYNAVVKQQEHANNQFDIIIKTQDVENPVENKTTIADPITTEFEDETNLDSKEFSLEYSTDEGQSRPESSLDANPEIQELKSKSVVKDILGKFSKSYPNLSTTETKKRDMKRTESVEKVQGQNESKTAVFEEEIEVPSVRNLKKLFDKENIDRQNKKDQVHSLTARSISKQFRQELKSHEENATHAEETLTNGISNDSQGEDVEELPADITKKGIAYFEKLGKRK